MKAKILFVIFLISVAAMDSEHIIGVGAVCLTSILLLYKESRKDSHKKKEPAATDSIKNNLHNCIIKQGKEMVNGKMQSLRRKLRQWRADRRCLPGMQGRRENETDQGR